MLIFKSTFHYQNARGVGVGFRYLLKFQCCLQKFKCPLYCNYPSNICEKILIYVLNLKQKNKITIDSISKSILFLQGFGFIFKMFISTVIHKEKFCYQVYVVYGVQEMVNVNIFSHKNH